MLRPSDDIRLLTINDTCRNDLMESLRLQVASRSEMKKLFNFSLVFLKEAYQKSDDRLTAFGLRKANGFVLLVSVIGIQID